MGKLFSTDGKLFRGMEKTVNVVYLNILFILFSIPIVTIGASMTAMFSVMMKMARDREGYMFQGFWKAFKDNFKQATIIWLVVCLIGSLIAADLYFFFAVATWSGADYVGMVFLGIGIILILAVIYLFPLQAQFENRVMQTLRNALFLASKHFGWSMLLLFIYLLTALLLYLFWYFAGWCIIGIGAYICAHIYNRIFMKYIPEELHDEY